jgi:hypothetical protein
MMRDFEISGYDIDATPEALAERERVERLADSAKTIEVKRFPVRGGTWHARADWTNSEWAPMPLFGPATFEDCKALLLKQAANREYSIVEVL